MACKAYLALHGMAGFVLANGSMYSDQSGKGDMRKATTEASLPDFIVALSKQLSPAN